MQIKDILQRIIIKFNPLKIITEKNSYNLSPIGKWIPKYFLKDKKVLILGSGASVKKRRSEITKFIKKNNLIVMALNTNHHIPENEINFRVVCHPNRIISDSFFYKDKKTNLKTPFSIIIYR